MRIILSIGFFLTAVAPVFAQRDSVKVLDKVIVNGVRTISGMGRLDEIHNGNIYSGKKTEVLLLDSLDANTAQNNPRQVLGRIPGANYSETAGSGFPSNGISFRGLNPSQSVETNTRQNGYNVTADIYGYSESYYLPPLEAVNRIEVTRGESSLQWGPQFGGVINYILKDGPKDRPFEYSMEQTGGSYGFFNSYHAAGGQLGKWNYFGFLQYQASQGRRLNSDYRQVSGFGKVSYQASDRLRIGVEYTLFRNRIHMPGGFDDAQFAQNPDTSYRARNWLTSPWNIVAAKAEYALSGRTTLYVTSSYLFSSRSLVWRNEDGGPETLDTVDATTLQYSNREVQREKMNSLTTEVRLLTRYDLWGMSNSLAAGVRVFAGRFIRQGGGLGTTGSDFNLSLLDPHYGYDLAFHTTNIAPFVENVFRITHRLSITPGVRFEYLRSTAKGYITDGGDVNSDNSKSRSFGLFGVGVQYKTSCTTNLYGNISQAYSPVTYDQLTKLGSTARVDPNMKDASGYNADLGWRGTVGKYLNFDIDGFWLAYNNRIGAVQLTDGNGVPYIFQTNIANSINKGVEAYIEFRPTQPGAGHRRGNLSVFNSLAYIDAKYTSGVYKGNAVEYAPKIIDRAGITYSRPVFSTTFLVSYTAKSYGDASNVVSSTDPSAGIIPDYTVLDWAATVKLSAQYHLKGGVNNLTDRAYFTKRTTEYPGPGIIPALRRSFYVSFGATF
ncbi:TonB-dependent receptor family protein [Puia dinghuensis]|uniref:TonB-dependent receptor n=1 Tax=Puia dinghuensis TaxID=1792502 RepID=A0A8J2UCS3_9BACT|nr:TonB-dependent receptor [Puia dinghuensis]GGA97963.1 TonB-dependent receptor [Puia dinghuensis]